MILVFHANGKDRWFRMPSVVAAKQLVIEPAGRVNALSIVEGKEAATALDEIPDSLLLSLSHPFHWFLLVAIRPVHPVAKNHEQLKVFECISIQCLDVF